MEINGREGVTMNGYDTDFEDFMKRVNRLMEETAGCNSRDIPDYAYWDCWDEGWTVLHTVVEALSEAGF